MNLREFSAPIAMGELRGLRGGTPGAPRVIALHGWLDNAASFVPLAACLPDLELVIPDLPGHGHSVHLGPGAEYTSGVAVNAVLDLADALEWEQFYLLGHSMGAGIASLLAASSPHRVQGLVAIEALGGLSETVARTAARWQEAIAAARALPDKRLRLFPDLAMPVRARMQANQLSEANARLLVERGVRAVEGGHVWSSDQRLTLPTPQRLDEAQVSALVAGIDCRTRVIYAEPAQPYFPEPLRSQRAGLLPHGELIVLPGTHHLHMEDPIAVAAAIGDFFQ
ncbi:epoxide hydrolase. Serine peptidase. MEROPS family S33 [Pseudoxanthomonas indica]|uniref:Epoxide hydrolase. Serine peptidase. MEROPS family S33 n=1 Tax=Pseudoxanthomonas indica TaxID=428993 RepID=A0A1T5KK88_9GAMM|nr:alpha/beta hydrolase [Pseudoxanthomonas indica]SKC64174.1 epoxide hydrolase. Serine peptidase. MEROPS family S33 [Pseudoxanthomonas indica]